MSPLKLGIDLGGTKIELCALRDGRELMRRRVATPREDYAATLEAIRELVANAERDLGERGSVGLGMPGARSRATGHVKNSNSTWLNGTPFVADLEAALGRSVRAANDANCLAVSEATDGAARGYSVVFGVILGTGVGAGVALDGRSHDGPNGVGGEWGHNSLPFMTTTEYDSARPCYCGRRGCIETWLSGPALAQDHASLTGELLTGPELVAAANAGAESAVATLDRYLERLARALGHVVGVLDPDIIVFGGGVSRLPRLYEELPQLLPKYVFGGECLTPLRQAKHGDSSGVRGAAQLW